MNLRGFYNLANMGQKVGVDLWNFETKDGRGIRKAFNFLLPFVNGDKKWEYKQITSLESTMETLKTNFLVAAQKTGNKKYLKVAQSMGRPHTNLDILLYPIFPQKGE